jgi:hypothetical protein
MRTLEQLDGALRPGEPRDQVRRDDVQRLLGLYAGLDIARRSSRVILPTSSGWSRCLLVPNAYLVLSRARTYAREEVPTP